MLWNQRTFDLVGQIGVIFAGVLAVLALFRPDNSPTPRETIMNNLWILNMGFVALLVGIGLYCLLTMRNTVKLLIGVEIIAKGVTLALIASGYARNNLLLAQSLVITVIVVDVAVIATALAIIININRHTKSLDVRKLTKLKG